jgi:NADP-dependent 3-hydroxy acid dehydrogenase YdfG
VLASELDVTDESQVAALFKQARERFGTLDALLNLAGLSMIGPIAEMDIERYNTIVNVNVMGTFLGSKHFIPCVDAEKGAQIINIGSMAAKRANPNAPLYCVAKAAVNMLSQGLALQLKESKVRVTTLNPGPIDTTFWGDRQVPREKFMKADDVAEVILFVLKMSENVVFHDVAFESHLFFK